MLRRVVSAVLVEDDVVVVSAGLCRSPALYDLIDMRHLLDPYPSVRVDTRRASVSFPPRNSRSPSPTPNWRESGSAGELFHHEQTAPLTFRGVTYLVAPVAMIGVMQSRT